MTVGELHPRPLAGQRSTQSQKGGAFSLSHSPCWLNSGHHRQVSAALHWLLSPRPCKCNQWHLKKWLPDLDKIYGAYWALNVTWVWYEGMWPVLKNEVWSNSLEKDENDMIAMTMGCAGEPWRCSEAWEMRYVASHLTVVWLWWPVTIVRHTLPVLPKATEYLLPHNPFHHTHSVIVTDI